MWWRIMKMMKYLRIEEFWIGIVTISDYSWDLVRFSQYWRGSIDTILCSVFILAEIKIIIMNSELFVN